MVCTVLNATIGTAVVGLGSLLPSQGAFLASTSLLTTRSDRNLAPDAVTPSALTYSVTRLFSASIFAKGLALPFVHLPSTIAYWG